MTTRIHHLWPVAETDYEPFKEHRLAALAILNSGKRQTRKAGQFLGQLVFDPSPMTPSQSEWLAKLLERCGLPPFVEGSAV